MALLVLLPLCLGAGSLVVGRVPLLGAPWTEISGQALLWRWERVVRAVWVGGALGLGGAVLRQVTANPLADPGLLGVASGGAVGALLAIRFGISEAGCALAGSAVSLASLLGLSGTRGAHHQIVPLVGVAQCALCGGAIHLLLSLGEGGVPGAASRWLSGGLVETPLSLGGALGGTAVLGLCTARLLGLSGDLGLLPLGDAFAASLGMSPARVRSEALAHVGILSALAVTAGGPVGFVGLVAPFLGSYLSQGGGFSWGAAWSVSLGASLVLTADLLARTLAPPAILPLGVFTALFGAPVLLFLAWRTPWHA